MTFYEFTDVTRRWCQEMWILPYVSCTAHCTSAKSCIKTDSTSRLYVILELTLGSRKQQRFFFASTEMRGTETAFTKSFKVLNAQLPCSRLFMTLIYTLVTCKINIFTTFYVHGIAAGSRRL